MPRESLEFRIVVASPSDVFNARKTVFDAIHELNRIFEIQRVTIRGLGWEEYTSPGIDTEPQSVINAQLLRDYDILVAVFGTKLGSPTKTQKSGTIEEIEKAILNASSEMGIHRVQVYFCDKIESISSVSLEELQQVAEYRKSLAARGVLYREFKSDDELQREIRVNLQRPISDYLQRHGRNLGAEQYRPCPNGVQSAPSTPMDQSPAANAGGDLGMLDYQEKAESSGADANNSIIAITGLIQEINTETNRNIAEVEKVSSPLVPAAEKKKVFNSFAEFLKLKAARLKEEVFDAKGYLFEYFNALSLIIDMDPEFSNPQSHASNMAIILSKAETLVNILLQNRESMASFKKSIMSVPRITIQFNQAKKSLIDALDDCTAMFEETERALLQIITKSKTE